MDIFKGQQATRIVDFAVPADYRVKLKECEKKGKYFNLAWELKNTGRIRGFKRFLSVFARKWT